jgi:hypothetical protein
MNKYNLIGNKRTRIIKKAKELIDSDDYKLIKDLINDCQIIDFYPKEIKEIVEKWKDFVIPDRKIKSKLIPYKTIMEYKCYRFFFDTGAMAQVFSIYARTHDEVWKQASSFIINEMDSHVRCVFCISIDEEDTGAFSNMNAMFEKKKPCQINSVKADDLFNNWRQYNLSDKDKKQLLKDKKLERICTDQEE